MLLHRKTCRRKILWAKLPMLTSTSSRIALPMATSSVNSESWAVPAAVWGGSVTPRTVQSIPMWLKKLCEPFWVCKIVTFAATAAAAVAQKNKLLPMMVPLVILYLFLISRVFFFLRCRIEPVNSFMIRRGLIPLRSCNQITFISLHPMCETECCSAFYLRILSIFRAINSLKKTASVHLPFVSNWRWSHSNQSLIANSL